MLQRAVWSQLARIEKRRNILSSSFSHEKTDRKKLIAVNYPGPLKQILNDIDETLKMLPPDEKHWFCGGVRSSAVATTLLRKNEIIAIPTDTIYGFAALAQSKECIDKLYALKGRDKTKPLAITISSVSNIRHWAVIDHVPYRLLTDLLPGPVTVVLKHTGKLNSALNPGHETIGIRVPRSTFIRHVCKMIGEPLALTSANLSNEPSSLHPDEFSALWPRLGGIFYDIPQKSIPTDSQRVGSTVVDLTIPGKFKILRKGVRFGHDIEILRQYGIEIKPPDESSTVNGNIVSSELQK